jgi:hypothetical protein
MDSESADSKASRLLKALFNGQKEQGLPTASTASVVELMARKDDRSPPQSNMNPKSDCSLVNSP